MMNSSPPKRKARTVVGGGKSARYVTSDLSYEKELEKWGKHKIWD